MRADRDILLLEQRGTGQSNGLKCAPETADPYWDTFTDEAAQQWVHNCLQGFTGDLSQYNTPNAVSDFAAMVHALGYAKVHLYGGSYGSRAALVFMRRYPELVASVVIDGMAPVQVIVGPFAQHGYRALNLLFSECEASPECQKQFPELRAQYWSLWARISKYSAQTPIRIDIRHPKTMAPQVLRLDRNKFFQMTLNNLYAQEQRQLLPYAISQAAQDNWHPFAGMMAMASDNGIYAGLATNILCNEDLARATDVQLAADAQTPFGDSAVAPLRTLCNYWPGQYTLKNEYYEPIASAIPTLALSGQLDPVTPPMWGDLTVAHLPQATHLIAHNAAHIVALRGCGPKLVRAFLNNPDAPLMQAECLTDLPKVTFMRSNNAH